MQPEKLGVEITAFMFKKLGVEITAFMFKKLGVEISAYVPFVPVIVNPMYRLTNCGIIILFHLHQCCFCSV